MRNAAHQVRCDSAENSVTGTVPVSSALGGFAAAPLTLPTFGPVPDGFTVVGSLGWWGKVAVAMLDADMLDPSGVWGAPDASMLSKKALDKWVSERLGKLQIIGLRVALADTLDRAMMIDGIDTSKVAKARSEPRMKAKGKNFFLSNVPCDWGFVCLERGFCALEAIASGLGQTIWSHIEGGLFKLGLNPVTPCRTEDIVSNNHWYGEHDESEARAEYESEKEFQESGIITRAAFDAAIPAVVCRAKAVLSWAKLKRIGKVEGGDPRARLLIAHALKFKELIGEEGPKVFSDSGVMDGVEDRVEQLNPSVFVRWNMADPTVEEFDNMANMYMQGGDFYYDGASGVDRIWLNDPKELALWMKEADRYFRGVRLLDEMLAIFEEFNK